MDMETSTNSNGSLDQVVPPLVDGLAALLEALEREKQHSVQKESPLSVATPPIKPLVWLATYLMRHNHA